VNPLRILGAGPTGVLLAILMQRRGHGDIDIFEARQDPRSLPAESGRSINLALADRGIHALKAAGVFQELGTAMLPMRARCIHAADGSTSLQPYGQRSNEVNYSISRHKLNQGLVEIAAKLPGVRFHFEHRLESADFGRGMAQIRDARTDTLLEVPMQPLLAADGAGSAMRRQLKQHGLIEARENDLAHGYKELNIPAGPHRSFRLAEDALHIWPRGNFMLIALPNDDGSFTATLFLPKQGPISFERLDEPGRVQAFLAQHFADAFALMPDALADFDRHPVGFLGSVDAAPWQHEGQTLLIGDAAHAMVPFHGQGMNCCFEDCLALDACLARHADWQVAFAEFSRHRKPDTDAITAMALENYSEMRERVADPRFQLQQALSLLLERRYPNRFIPRYAMVMFHHEIPYHVAQQRGAVQTRILDELTSGGASTLAQIDIARASREIEAELPPL
jgi:kynurenine 3-monooxygenase